MMSYRVYNDELYHHGVQGMKWGVRRYQNEDGSLTEEGRVHYYGDHAERPKVDYSPNSYKKQLNKGDRAMAKAQYRIAKAEYKTNKLRNKLTNGYDQKKDEKIQQKIEKQQAKADEARSVYEYGEKRAKQLIKDAEKNGISINSKETYRYVSAGEDATAYIVAGIPGLLVSDAVKVGRAYTTGDDRLTGFVRGTQYEARRK